MVLSTRLPDSASVFLTPSPLYQTMSSVDCNLERGLVYNPWQGLETVGVGG